MNPNAVKGPLQSIKKPVIPNPNTPGSNDRRYNQVPQQPTCTREKNEKNADIPEPDTAPPADDLRAPTGQGNRLLYVTRKVCIPITKGKAANTGPLIVIAIVNA